MCLPTLAAGGAAMLGGQLLTNSADRSAIKARNRALSSEQARQRAFRDEAFRSFDRSHQALGRPAQDAALADAVASRTAAVQSAVTPAAGFAPGAGSAPAVVKGDYARRMADAVAAGRETAKQLGALSGFGDLQFGNNLQLANSGRNIALQSSLAQGSAGVLPYELQSAYNKGGGRRQVGDILGSLGNVALMAGLTGNDPFASLFAKTGKADPYRSADRG